VTTAAAPASASSPARRNEPLARCVDVSRTYGAGPTAVVAVHGATCEIGPRDRIALVGASGSGKSTLLHLLAGLEPATTGAVTWPGFGPPPARSPGAIGVVFQGPSLIPALDVAENVALPLVLAGADETSSAERAAAALTRLGVADLASKLPEELSGGQAQRVAVARVLAARPRLILADEPTGQLDHTTAAHVIDVLVTAADELGAALMITTHDPDVAARMQQQWPMHSGRLDTGSPRPALAQSQTPDATSDATSLASTPAKQVRA
jgi:ABC-type lipoprotein export system ATPase subunit